MSLKLEGKAPPRARESIVYGISIVIYETTRLLGNSSAVGGGRKFNKWHN